MNIKQFRIYKLSTFDLFTDAEKFKLDNIENDVQKGYVKIKGNYKADYRKAIKAELSEFIASNTIQREVREKAINLDKQITIFDNEITRLIDNKVESEIDKNDKKIPLLETIIFVKIFNIDILNQILNNGFSCFGKEYCFLTASAGQIRKSCITCIEKEFLIKNHDILYNGLSDDIINNSEEKGCNVGKFLAYKALNLSASIPINIDIDKVIVVEDFESIVAKDIEYINHKTYETTEKTMDKPISHTDGAGMFLPDTIQDLTKSCQIRAKWIKGALFPFDFKKFSVKIANNTKIRDIYNDEWDIVKDKIQIILCKSQFKMWKYYKNWKDYKDKFKDNKLSFAITNEANEPKYDGLYAYQFLQTLEMTPKNVELLCQKSINLIKKLHNDEKAMLNVLGANVNNKNLEPFQEALLLYPTLLQDEYVKNQVRTAVQNYRRNAMGGKILLEGSYSYICPDWYAACEVLFQNKKNPEGLIPEGCVYNSYYNNKEYRNTVNCVRSPHLYREHCKRTLIKNDDCKKWFIGSDTIISCHDLTLLQLMADVDGDACRLTTSRPIIDSVVDTLPIYYEMEKAKPQEINTENIYNTLVKGFEASFVDDISNNVTKLWNTSDKTNMKMIKIMQMYTNFTIDFPKTGFNLTLPKKIQEKYDELKKQSNPYFFRYAKNKKNYQPSNDSVVNRISGCIYQHTLGEEYEFGKNVTAPFNYAILASDVDNIDRNSNRYVELERMLIKWNYKIKHLKMKLDGFKKYKEDRENYEFTYNIWYQYCKDELLEIFNDKQELVNTIIDIEYCQRENKKRSKKILWKCFGNIVLQNIKANLKSDKEIKSRHRLAYDTKEKEKYYRAKPELKLLDTPKSTDITEYDLKVMDSMDNESDRIMYYVLICFCRVYKKLTLYKSKKSKMNMHKIEIITGYDGGELTLNRLQEHGLVSVQLEGKKTIITLPNEQEGEGVFKAYVNNPLLYLAKHEGKALEECLICGKEFIKIKNNKTCSEKHAIEAAKRTKQEYYEKNKKSS